jgi:hypothetical protein
MTDGAIRRVAELADSASFGARELDRVFRNHVLLPAAEAVHALRSAQPSARGTVVVDRSPEGGLSVVLRADAAGP